MNPDSKPNPPSDSAAMPPASSPSRRIVRCPRCGGTHVRRPTRPLLSNVIACPICLSLTLATGVMSWAAIPFVALPVTTGVALLGRRRCLNCRHRFALGSQIVKGPALPRFPWRFHTLNIIILVFLCSIGPYIMRKWAGAGRLSDEMLDLRNFMTLVFFLWTSLLYHVILYYTLRRRLAHPLIWAILFVLPGTWGGARAFHRSLPSVQVRALLTYSRLAPLPQSATGIRVYSWSSPFSGEDFLRFTADPNDIERFLSASRALQGQEPQRYSAQMMRLALPKDFRSIPNDGNEYFVARRGTPRWYKQEIRGPTRKYIVQPPRYQFPGEVLVDDETNTVYVYLCFS